MSITSQNLDAQFILRLHKETLDSLKEIALEKRSRPSREVRLLIEDYVAANKQQEAAADGQ